MKRTNEEIEKFLLEIIREVDYDIYKSFVFPEDPDYDEDVTMERLIKMTHDFLEDDQWAYLADVHILRA